MPRALTLPRFALTVFVGTHFAGSAGVMLRCNCLARPKIFGVVRLCIVFWPPPTSPISKGGNGGGQKLYLGWELKISWLHYIISSPIRDCLPRFVPTFVVGAFFAGSNGGGTGGGQIAPRLQIPQYLEWTLPAIPGFLLLT